MDAGKPGPTPFPDPTQMGEVRIPERDYALTHKMIERKEGRSVRTWHYGYAADRKQTTVIETLILDDLHMLHIILHKLCNPSC